MSAALVRPILLFDMLGQCAPCHRPDHGTCMPDFGRNNIAGLNDNASCTLLPL